MVHNPPIDFFGHSEIERTGASLHVSNGQAQLAGRERPRQGVALFELAEVYRALGERERARPLLARYGQYARRRREMLQAANAVMANPESARAHAAMGQLCLEEGRIGRAILSLERALALQPGFPGARAALVRARRAADSAAADDE